jgi:hypothetical protein
MTKLIIQSYDTDTSNDFLGNNLAHTTGDLIWQ